ncbi:hypothetical protein ACFLQ2_03150 [archaeon]
MKLALLFALLLLAGCVEISAGPPLHLIGIGPTPTPAPTFDVPVPTPFPTPTPTVIPTAVPAPTAWAYSCEKEYDSLTAAEIYLMTDCFRHAQQHHACIKWGIERGLENQAENFPYAKAYFGSAQRCAIGLGYTDTSIKIGKWLAAYEACWLPNLAPYNACLATYETANKANWVTSEDLAAIANSYSTQAQQELS